MPKIDSDTKEKILAAAEKVFHAQGFKGTRTTQIAEAAGISRTMLHYYFSTKEELFQEVLSNTMSAVLGHMKRIIADQHSLNDLIGHLVDVVADLLEEKPGLPSFIVNILNETPELAHFMAASQEDTLPRLLDQYLFEARQTGKNIPEMTGEDLILNIYALCSITYLTAPYIKAKENRDDEAMKAFNRQRRNNIKSLIIK